MNILVPDITIVVKVLRAGVVYAFLLLISNVLQNAMIGDDNSLTGGLIGAVTILVLNSLVAYLTFRFKRIDRVVEHSPTVLVRHGRIIRDNLRRERLGPRDLRAALRHHGVVSLRDIRYAFLEEDGHVSVVTRRPPGE